MVGAGGWGEVVELVDLLGAQLDTIGGDVLLDPRDPLGAQDRNDVVALCQQPGQGHLRRRRTDLAGDAVDFVGDAQVALEVLTGEPRVRLSPVAVREIVDGVRLSIRCRSACPFRVEQSSRGWRSR